MQHSWNCTGIAAWALALTTALVGPALAQSEPLRGAAAFGDWRTNKPGVIRLIRPEDLPKPGATPSTANGPHIVRRPPSVVPQVPAGFEDRVVRRWTERTAPDAGGAQRRHLRLGNRPRENSRAARGRRKSKTFGKQSLRQRASPAVRHRLLSERQQSAVGLCRRDRSRRPLPLQSPAISSHAKT